MYTAWRQLPISVIRKINGNFICCTLGEWIQMNFKLSVDIFCQLVECCWYMFIDISEMGHHWWSIFTTTLMIWIGKSTSVYLYRQLTHPPWTKWPPFQRPHFQVRFCEWKFCILIWITWKYIPKHPINNKSSLVQVMAWCQTASHCLNQCWPSSSMHICATRVRWVKTFSPTQNGRQFVNTCPWKKRSVFWLIFQEVYFYGYSTK